jgi:hypothetical protein
LVSTGSNAVQWANGTTNWTAAGTIQSVGLGGTTSAPSIAAAVSNQIYYRSVGPKMWEVSFVLDKIIGGTLGGGDYLFTLPNGLRFDTTLQNQRGYGSSVQTSDLSFPVYGLQGSTGAIRQTGNLSLMLQPVIWSATQYRLVINFGGFYRAWGVGFFQIPDATNASAQFQFQST